MKQQLEDKQDAAETIALQALAFLATDGERLERFLALTGMGPDELRTRARERGFAQVIACEIHPLQNLRVLKYLADEFDADAGQTSAWLARWLGDGLEACEGLLAQRDVDTPFCYGDTPGIADICLVPQVFSAERFDVDISHLTRVNKIYQNCAVLPEFEQAHPKNQPDFEP